MGDVGSIISSGYHGALLNPVKSAANIISDPTSKSAWMQGLKDTTNPDPSGLLPSGVDNVLSQAAPYALSLIPGVGVPLAVAYSAANTYGNTGSLKDTGINAAGTYASTSGLGGQLGEGLGASGAYAPALGNAIIGAGTSAATGGNPLEGAAVGAAGGYLGGGGANDLFNFSGDSGLSQLFGGTAAPSSDLASEYGAINNTAPNLETTAGATAPVNFAPGGASASYLPAGGTGASSLAGGGTGSGFDLGSIGESSALPSSSGIGSPSFSLDGAGSGVGVGGTTPKPGFLSSLFSSPSNGFKYDSTGSPVGASAMSIGDQFASAATPAATTGGSSVGSSILNNGGNLLANGLLRGGLAALLNNNNKSGYMAQENAGNQIQQEYQPFVTNGTNANNTLSALLGQNGTTAAQQAAAQANWQNTPGYQFALQQGLNAVNADAAAKGQTLSGNNQQAIQQYGSGLANQTYNNYLQNLQSQVGTGLNAAGGAASGIAGTANAAQGYGAQQANNQNNLVGGIASSLFPSANINLGALFGGGGGGGGNVFSNGANDGILNYLFG